MEQCQAKLTQVEEEVKGLRAECRAKEVKINELQEELIKTMRERSRSAHS